jgi:hypothetical protein
MTKLIDDHNVLGLVIVVLAASLLVFGKLTGDQWIAIVQVVFITLVSGNAVMHTATQVTANHPVAA